MWRRLRSQFMMVCLFSFISLGQAYPYVLIGSMLAREHCLCREAGRACRHGCQLKKIAKPQASCPHKAKAASQDWISPDCNGGASQTLKSISFVQEPFLLVAWPREVPLLRFPPVPTFQEISPLWDPSLEPPPPRQVL